MVANNYIVSNKSILAKRTSFTDNGSWHHVTKMPNAGSFAYYSAVIYN
jgi:hypothetical protein